MEEKQTRNITRSLIMGTTFLAGVIGTGLIGPNRSAIEAEFELSHTQFGIGMALASIVFSLAILYFTPKLRKAGNANIMLASLVVLFVSLFMMFFQKSVWGVVCAWALSILGMSLGSVANNISMLLWQDNPRKGVTLLHGFNSIGKFIGPIVAALFMAYGWRYSFLAASVMCLVVILPFIIFRKPASSYDNHEEGIHINRKPLKNPFFWFSVMLIGLISGGELAFATLMPLYYENIHAFTPQKASLFFSVHLAGLLAGRFISAAISRRVSANIIIGFCVSTGIFVFPVAFSKEAYIQLPSLFMLGFMFSAVWPQYYAQAKQHWKHCPTLFAYGIAFGNASLMPLCVMLSSRIADFNLKPALISGIIILWIFAGLYFLSPLSKEIATKEE